MSYDPTTDFLGLLRLVGTGLRSERMPGLDYIVSALNRMGLFSLSVGQVEPTVNQITTVWLKPAIPSWEAEGTVYLWNAAAAAYQPATPTLWQLFLSPVGSIFQSLPAAINIVNAGVSLGAVQRVAPAVTGITLPTIAAQFATQKDLSLIDYSTGVVNHTITITPTGAGATIMQQPSWQLLSTAVYLAGIRLRPSPDLNAWVIV